MQAMLVEFLVCPRCRGRLSLSIPERASEQNRAQDSERRGVRRNGQLEGGSLSCLACGSEYPIREGVPRIVIRDPEERGAAETFGYEWAQHGAGTLEGATVFGRTAEQDRDYFLSALRLSPEDVRNRFVLDAGCGSGQLTAEIGRMESAMTVGVDVNTAIEEPYRRTRELANVHIVQADLRDLPFAPAVFDYVWCNGVLHHMADPRAGFNALARHLKPGGRLYVWVYEKRWNPFRFMHDVLRGIGIDRWPLPSVLRAAKILAYVSFAVHSAARLPWRLTKAHVHGRLERAVRYRGIRELELTWFDAISPRYDWRFSERDVTEWFRAAGFSETHAFSHPVGICGVRDRSVPPGE